MPWDDYKVTQLRQLHAVGSTYTEMADSLAVSRNAIAGKLLRLGLTEHLGPRVFSQNETKRFQAPRPRPENVMSRMPEPRNKSPDLPPSVIAPELGNKTIMELEHGDCRWLCDDGLYCGKPIVLRSYCLKHARISYHFPK